MSIDQYPLENCIVPGICIDLRHIAPRAEITPDDLEAAVAKAGAAGAEGRHRAALHRPSRAHVSPQGICKRQFRRRTSPPPNGWRKQGIVHFGIDSMRPGPEGKVNALVHKACLDLDITHIESLCNLEALLGRGPFTFIGLPMKWRGGTASPIRAVAVFDM